MSIVFFFSVLICCSLTLLLLCRRLFDVPFIFTLHIALLMGIPPFLHFFGFELSYNIFTLNNPENMNIKLSIILFVFTFGLVTAFLGFKGTNFGTFLFPDYNYARSDKVFLLGLCVLTFLAFVVVLFPLRAANFNVLQAVSNVRFEGFFFGGLNVLRQFVFFAAMLSGAYFVYLSKIKHEKIKSISDLTIYFVLLLFILNIFFSIILGGKSFVVFPLTGTLLAYILCRQKINYSALIIMGLLMINIVIGLQFFRTQVVAEMNVPASDNIYNGMYFVVYDTTLLYLEADEEILKTQLGEDFGNSFIAIVPRVLWPDKPTSQISAGNRFAHALLPHKDNPGGRPPYGMAQWYVNFGWIGALMGGLITGWLLTVMQDQYRDFRNNPFSFMIMWHFIFMVLGPWPGGLHNTSVMNYILYIFPLFIFKWLTTKSLYQTPDTMTHRL